MTVTYDGDERHDLTHVLTMCIDHDRLGLPSPPTSPPRGPGSRFPPSPQHAPSRAFSILLRRLGRRHHQRHRLHVAGSRRLFGRDLTAWSIRAGLPRKGQRGSSSSAERPAPSGKPRAHIYRIFPVGHRHGTSVQSNAQGPFSTPLHSTPKRRRARRRTLLAGTPICRPHPKETTPCNRARCAPL